ncbi:hypothetical protein C8Q74DRAFT_1256173 [Fomes fomentarius]|nr:hypothetical protein C8Q74DRAFT_1256173 [Fomes fomentarius]
MIVKHSLNSQAMSSIVDSDFVSNTYGTFLLGTFIGIIFHGIGVHQTYRYFRVYSTDTLLIRTLVVGLLALETAQTVFSGHACYYYLVTNYFKPNVLSHSVWSVNALIISEVLIVVISQIFFLRRISLISPWYKLISAATLAFLVWNVVCKLLLAYYGLQSGNIDVFITHKWLVRMGYIALTIVNLAVTGSLFAVMKRARPGVNSNKPAPLSNPLIVYAINTGLLVLVADFVTMILALSRSDVLYWLPLSLVTPRLYMNTLLSVLNTRQLLVSRGADIFNNGSFGPNFLSRAQRLATVERWNVPQLPEENPPMMVDIKVTREIEGEDAVGTSSATSQHDDGKSHDMTDHRA